MKMVFMPGDYCLIGRRNWHSRLMSLSESLGVALEHVGVFAVLQLAAICSQTWVSVTARLK